MLDPNDPVGVLAASNSALRNALEDLGIDYCCSGNRSLADAAAAEGLPVRSVLAAIERVTVTTEPTHRPWADASVRDVVAHLQSQYDRMSLESLAKIAVLFEVVADARVLDAELLEPVRQTFHRFVNDVVPHREREHHILFPILIGLEESWNRAGEQPPRFEGGLRHVVAENFLEHERMNEELRELRSGRALLACIDDRNCRRLAAALQQLEAAMHETVNLENFVLFPRALAIEDQLTEHLVAVGA